MTKPTRQAKLTKLTKPTKPRALKTLLAHRIKIRQAIESHGDRLPDRDRKITCRYYGIRTDGKSLIPQESVASISPTVHLCPRSVRRIIRESVVALGLWKLITK